MREQEQESCQAFLAGIEQLVDQVLFNAAVAGQQVGHEHLGEFRLVQKRRPHRGPGDGGDHAVLHRPCRSDAQRMAVQAIWFLR